MNKVIGYLRLMRPANIITAIADILAGVALANSARLTQIDISPVIFLVLSTSFLYGGGVVLNDVFDAELDKIERPERPIPSGLIKKTHAASFGISLLLLGIACAAYSNAISAVVAASIAAAAITYDKWLKHHSFFGPLNMGICRGLNLLLGMSIFPAALSFWFLAIVPVIYIFAITMISRGEVHGGKKTTMYTAALLYAIVIAAILFVAYRTDYLITTIPFLVFFAAMIYIPLLKAIEKPEGRRIGKAVKSGVISLIIMNAAWSASCGNLRMALVIVVLLPISILLARLFAVT